MKKRQEIITVFGASGIIGKSVVLYALTQGFKIRAFTRNPQKILPSLKTYGIPEKVIDVIHGYVVEPEEVDKAIEGTDYVVICLGTCDCLSPMDDLSEGTNNIINSMKKHNVKTLSVCLSYFLYPEEPPLNMVVNIVAEHRRMYDLVKESGLNYIAVFPPDFTKKAPTGDLIITLNDTKKPGKFIYERSLGTFLVDCLMEPKYYNNVVGICNP